MNDHMTKEEFDTWLPMVCVATKPAYRAERDGRDVMIRPITLPCDYKAYVTYYPKKVSLALPRGVRYVEFAGAGRYKAALRHLVKIMEEINGQN